MTVSSFIFRDATMFAECQFGDISHLLPLRGEVHNHYVNTGLAFMGNLATHKLTQQQEEQYETFLSSMRGTS